MEFIYSFFQVWFSILCVAFAGCKDDFDDSELRKEIADLDGRLTSLEKLWAQMNTNISSMQTIVNALQQNDFKPLPPYFIINIIIQQFIIFHSFLLFKKSHKITLVLFSTSLILQTTLYPSDTSLQVPQGCNFSNHLCFLSTF